MQNQNGLQSVPPKTTFIKQGSGKDGNGTTAIPTLVESAMAYGASTFHPSVKEKSTDLIRNLIQKGPELKRLTVVRSTKK